jgi:hypothetical protein
MRSRWRVDSRLAARVNVQTLVGDVGELLDRRDQIVERMSSKKALVPGKSF